MGFKRVEQYVASIKALLLDGKEITMDNSSIGEIIEIPDWSMMNASTDAQMALLQQQRDDYRKKAEQYPQVGNWVQSIVSRYDAMLSSKREGFVLAGGRWVEKNKVIEINSKAYTNTRVEAVKNGWVLLKHDGGTTSLPISELSNAVLGQLKALAPELFTVEAMTITPPKPNSSALTEAATPSAPPRTFKAASERYRAVAVDWNQLLIGRLQLEVGKAYQLGPYAKAIVPTGVLGTFDFETTLYVIAPPEGGVFTNLPTANLPGVPIGFEAVGIYEKSSSTGTGKIIPVFRCLFMSSTKSGAIMYNSSPTSDTPKP